MAMTTDNATTNDNIFRNVSRYLLSLYDIPEHRDRQIRCLAHVINLVVQAILAGLNEADAQAEDPKDELLNDDLNDYYLSNKDHSIHYDVSTDPVQEELEAERDADMALEFLDIGEFKDELLGIGEEVKDELRELGLTSALKKVSKTVPSSSSPLTCYRPRQLRFIVKKIASLPQRRQRFYKFSEAEYGDRRAEDGNQDSPLLRLLMVVRDVRTRWNSTHAMIIHALLLREVRVFVCFATRALL